MVASKLSGARTAPTSTPAPLSPADRAAHAAASYVRRPAASKPVPAVSR